MKKLVSFVLAVVLAASLLPVQVWGATVVDSGECGADGGNVTWTLDSDGVLTIEGTGEMKDYTANVSVPWYSQRDNIKDVQIQEGVTSIGDWAFELCSSLTSVSIPDSVTTIGCDAFSNCSSLTSVTIPDSVTSIGEGAFFDCYSLTSVSIPDSVTTIGRAAFHYCSSLTSVTIPNSMTHIEAGTFAYCKNLANIKIPESVVFIGNSAFSYCHSLTSILTSADCTIEIGYAAYTMKTKVDTATAVLQQNCAAAISP